jgi:phage gpG-like protein
MLDAGLRDSYSAALAGMPDRVRQALSDKANALAAALQEKVQQKLAGTVLNTKSGALAGSIVVTVDDASANVAARIATSPDIKYAAIQEYGGTIPPHEIVPDKAKALAFVVGGKQMFAARVQIPAVTLPERSYMRSSLAEMADEIKDGLSEAVVGAIR